VSRIRAPPSARLPVRSSSAWRPGVLSPLEARTPAASMRFRLCSPLPDRDRLAFDLPAALHRETDGVGVGTSGHGSVRVTRSSAR
jgi:hypothetical protein